MIKNDFTVYQSNSHTAVSHLVVLLHGYGSNANDLITIAPELNDCLPNAKFISPNAPFKYENASFGYQWYSLANRSIKNMMENYNNVAPILDNFIKEQLKLHNLSYKDLIIGGFSQGGMMALHYSLGCAQTVAGVISCSGYIVNDGNFEPKSKPSVLLTHGDMDAIVPFSAFEHTLHLLHSKSIPTEAYQAKGLGHGIDHGCINAINSFLKKL